MDMLELHGDKRCFYNFNSFLDPGIVKYCATVLKIQGFFGLTDVVMVGDDERFIPMAPLPDILRADPSRPVGIYVPCWEAKKNQFKAEDLLRVFNDFWLDKPGAEIHLVWIGSPLATKQNFGAMTNLSPFRRHVKGIIAFDGARKYMGLNRDVYQEHVLVLKLVRDPGFNSKLIPCFVQLSNSGAPYSEDSGISLEDSYAIVTYPQRGVPLEGAEVTVKEECAAIVGGSEVRLQKGWKGTVVDGIDYEKHGLDFHAKKRIQIQFPGALTGDGKEWTVAFPVSNYRFLNFGPVKFFPGVPKATIEMSGRWITARMDKNDLSECVENFSSETNRMNVAWTISEKLIRSSEQDHYRCSWSRKKDFGDISIDSKQDRLLEYLQSPGVLPGGVYIRPRDNFEVHLVVPKGVDLDLANFEDIMIYDAATGASVKRSRHMSTMASDQGSTFRSYARGAERPRGDCEVNVKGKKMTISIPGLHQLSIRVQNLPQEILKVKEWLKRLGGIYQIKVQGAGRTVRVQVSGVSPVVVALFADTKIVLSGSTYFISANPSKQVSEILAKIGELAPVAAWNETLKKAMSNDRSLVPGWASCEDEPNDKVAVGPEAGVDDKKSFVQIETGDFPPSSNVQDVEEKITEIGADASNKWGVRVGVGRIHDGAAGGDRRCWKISMEGSNKSLKEAKDFIDNRLRDLHSWTEPKKVTEVLGIKDIGKIAKSILKKIEENFEVEVKLPAAGRSATIAGLKRQIELAREEMKEIIGKELGSPAKRAGTVRQTSERTPGRDSGGVSPEGKKGRTDETKGGKGEEGKGKGKYPGRGRRK